MCRQFRKVAFWPPASDVGKESSSSLFFIMALTKFSLASFPLVDLPSSSAVHGIVTEDGLFDGHISTPEEHYYIEPASRYFSSLEDDVKQPFHSVIYKASDVIHPNLDEDGEVSVLQCIRNRNLIWLVQCCQLI